jgi:hypothetical protein
MEKPVMKSYCLAVLLFAPLAFVQAAETKRPNIVSMGVHFNFKTNPQTLYPKDEYLAEKMPDKAK